MWTFEAQTLYGLKYINERSKICTNTDRHVYKIIAKLLVDKFLSVIAKKKNFEYLSFSPYLVYPYYFL